MTIPTHMNARPLQRLMDFKSRQNEEILRCDEILNQVGRGNLLALEPYVSTPKCSFLLNDASNAMMQNLLKERHLTSDQVGYFRLRTDSGDKEIALATNQRQMDELFGPGKITCVLVKNGEDADSIGSIGVTAVQLNAALKVDSEKKMAEQKAGVAETDIQKRITRQCNKSAWATEHTVSPASTPYLATWKTLKHR